MREDLDKSEKKECISKVKDVLDSMKNVVKASFETKNELSFTSKIIDDLVETENKSPIKRQDSSLKVTQSGTYANFKGYLQKKNKQKILKFDERFFSIKNDRLYWYKSHKSREPINSISLIDAEVVYQGKNQLRFDIKTANKTIKLLAKDQEDKQNWLKALEKPADTEFSVTFFNDASKESIFEDFSQQKSTKRDLMRVANWVLAEIPRRRQRKEKTETKTELKAENETNPSESSTNIKKVEYTEEDEEDSGCCCFAFFKKKKKSGNNEPLLIND